jgi:hypothetical protein
LLPPPIVVPLQTQQTDAYLEFIKTSAGGRKPKKKKK